MAKMIQKSQFGERTSLIFQCHCGEDSYLNVERMDFDGDVDYHVWISTQPRYLSDRVKEAWKALRGQHAASSAYIMLSPEQLTDLIKELTEHSR